MATHPDDPHVPQPGDQQDPANKPAEGEQGKQSKHTKLPRQPGKPTMIQHDEEESAPATVPNMSLDEPHAEITELQPVADETEMIPPGALPHGEDDVPVLEAVPDDEATEAMQAPSDVVEMLPVAEEDVLTTDKPAEETPPKDKSKSHVTAELLTPKPAPRANDDVLFGKEDSGAAPSDIVEAEPASGVAEAQPASDVAEAEAVFEEMEAEPISGLAEALPASGARSNEGPGGVTGADMPGAEVTGSEYVLGEDLAEHETAPARDSAEPASGAEAVLGDEPLDRGSRPSARVESPIRAEPDDESVDLGGPPASAGKKPAGHADLDATEEVLAGEPAGRGSSAINWNDIGADSGAVAKPAVDETVPYDISGEGSSDDSLLHAEDLAKHADDSSAINLGEMPPKSKSPSGIDVVAEALESGVNLEDEAPLSPKPGSPSVEFDDVLADSSESLPPAKKGATKASAPEDLETLEPTDDDLDAVGKAKKKKKKAGADVDDEAAALFASEEDAEAVAVPAEDEAEAVAVPADEDEAVAAPVADEDTDEVASSKKTDIGGADEREPPSTKTRGKGKPQPAPVRGPSCLGRLVGAAVFTLLGVLLAIGALAGVMYVEPGTADTWYKAVANVPPPIKTVQPMVTPVQRAYSELAAGNYDQVVEDLKDDNDPAAVGARGEARWLKYVKGKLDSKQPLNEKDKDVQDALKDLRESKHDLRADEILKLVRQGDDPKQMEDAKKSIAAMTKTLAKAEAERKQADALVKDIGGVLVGAKIIADPAEVSPDSVRKLAKEFSDSQAALASLNKALEDANVADKGPKGIAALVAAKKQSEEKLSAVDKLLAEAKVKDPGAKGVEEVLASRAQVQKDRDELDAATKAAYQELVKASVLPPGGDPRKGLAQGIKLAREKGESPLAGPLSQLGSALAGLGQGVGRMVAASVDTSLLAADLALLKAREPFIQTPAQKLDLYAALLQNRDVNGAKELDAIRREADWVLTRDASVSPAARAKALYVTGLALRNEGKFDAARKALADAVKHAGAKDAAWQKQAQADLVQLSDPRAYYLPQIARLRAVGDLAGAVAETNLALKVMPGNGKLLAERGMLRLEDLRAKGKLSAEAQKQIRSDAEAAAKSAGAAADGEYVLGLLDEELGQYGNAEAHFRAAIKAHKGSDDTAARYRVALARVLLQDRPAAAAPAAPAASDVPVPADDKKGEGTETPADRPISFVHPVTGLILAATIGAQPEPDAEQENAATAKRLREAIELAQALANSKSPQVREQGYALLAEAAAKAGRQLTSTSCQELAKGLVNQPDPKVRGTGLMLMGQSLVKQGKRTEGLKEYTRGLELVHPGLATQEIGRMVEEHPAFQHPDVANKPNPLLAEKHFGNGVHLYWAGNYPAAEAQFKQAMDYFGNDARYAYFLGLSQLAQNSKLKRDQAFYSFEQGARLEAQGQPSIADINISLERIQGGLRQLLNGYRSQGAAPAAQ